MRGRHNDCLNLQGLVDSPDAVALLLAGFVEGSRTWSETAYAAERKTQFLPMVALRHGVPGLDSSTAKHMFPMESGFPFSLRLGKEGGSECLPRKRLLLTGFATS